MVTPNDFNGRKVGFLVVLDVSGNNKYGQRLWHCKCVCGKEVFRTTVSLKRGGINSSCGCKLKEGRRTTHGACHTKAFSSWRGMIQRCINPKDPGYKNYGGRGIKICDSWHNNFEFFLADMGQPPRGDYSIDRINNDGNYEPGNCRWATRKQQNRNRRGRRPLTWNGKTQIVAEWADELGIPRAVLDKRLFRGWSVERTLTEPYSTKPRAIRMLTWNGKTQSISEWAEELNVPRNWFDYRLKESWSIPQIFEYIIKMDSIEHVGKQVK